MLGKVAGGQISTRVGHFGMDGGGKFFRLGVGYFLVEVCFAARWRVDKISTGSGILVWVEIFSDWESGISDVGWLRGVGYNRVNFGVRVAVREFYNSFCGVWEVA